MGAERGSPGLSVALLIVLLAACSATARGSVVEATPATVTTLPPVDTATVETAQAAIVHLRLHPVEALATHGGHRIEVAVAGRILGFLDDGAPKLTIEVSPPAELTFSYRALGGGVTEVTWHQTVDPGASDIVVVQPWRRPGRAASWQVLAWSLEADHDETAVAVTDGRGVTVLSPITWRVTEDGEVEGEIDTDLVDVARSAGVVTWPAIAALDAETIPLVVGDPERRMDLAARLAAETRAAGAGGVNLDIEGYYEEDADDVSAFVEAVAAAVHEWGGTVSYDLVPRSEAWDVIPAELAYWSTAPDRRRIAAAVDVTVLMAYDQYNRTRPAGPVAAPAWVEEMIVYQLRYADPQDIILGVPAYGRIWDPAELDAPRAVSLGFIEGLDGERVFDDRFDIDRLELDDGTFTWDESSIQADRIALAEAYGLGGVAVWRLGLDSTSLWEAIP